MEVKRRRIAATFVADILDEGSGLPCVGQGGSGGCTGIRDGGRGRGLGIIRGRGEGSEGRADKGGTEGERGVRGEGGRERTRRAQVAGIEMGTAEEEAAHGDELVAGYRRVSGLGFSRGCRRDCVPKIFPELRGEWKVKDISIIIKKKGVKNITAPK